MKIKVLSYLLAAAVTAAGQEEINSPLPDKGDGFLTFYLDNDLFGGTDENYTNGVRLSWISGSRDVRNLGPVQQGLRKLIGDEEGFSFLEGLTGLSGQEPISYNYGFSLTQLIFTPEDPLLDFVPEGERPYAGYLGLGLSLHAKDSDTLNSAELSFGVIGPSALAEEAQDTIHAARGFEKFNGWDEQIPDEPTLTLSLVQKRRFDLTDYGALWGGDGLTEWGGQVGNFRTTAFLGFLARWGYNTPVAFSDPRLSTTAYSHKPFSTDDEAQKGNWSLYGLTGARVTAVAFDATLDGPLFRDFDTNVSSEPFIAEAYLGFGIRYRAVEFSYVHTFRTQEFQEQDDGAQAFGSIAVRFRY